MFQCNICNRKFNSKATYVQHLSRESKKNDLLHKNELIKLKQNDLPNDLKYIKILNVSYGKDGRCYLQTFNPKCGHSSLIRQDHLINSISHCNHKDCTSKNKSLGLKGKPKSYMHRQNIWNVTHSEEYINSMSNILKNKWKEDTFRNKTLQRQKESRHIHATKIAESQKLKCNKDELIFKDLLDKYNIKYIWQYPFVDDNIETIVDFYLPDINTLVYIDGYIHEAFSLPDKDRIQTNYLQSINFNVIRLLPNDIDSFVDTIRKR